MSDEKEYIVWTNYGVEGWKPTAYSTLMEAVKHKTYGDEFLITKKVGWIVTEIEPKDAPKRQDEERSDTASKLARQSPDT